jgi:hypothetical protein
MVRENTEGEYAGHGGRAHRGLPEEVATETSIFTRRGVSRIMRFAFKLAQQRPRKLLTVVTKSNAQRHGMVFWDEIAAEVSQEFPDVTWDKMLVDAMTTRMVAKPSSLQIFTLTSSPTWLPPSPAVSESLRLATLTQNVGFLRCSSRFTAQHLTLLAEASPIPSVPCGVHR